MKQDSYSFSVESDQILTSSNNTFNATFNIYEGTYVSDSYIVDRSIEIQKFKITNKSIDTDSLSVLVYENGNTNPTTYKRANTLLDLNENSQVYFVEAATGGGYQVLFGDSIIGRLPNDGSVIVLDYRVTAGELSNGAKNFTPNFDPTNSGGMTAPMNVTVNPYTANTSSTYSVNGAAAESLDSIRYYAPRHFQTQERAVTSGDYSILLKNQFPEISAISVYGGEEADPPRYGKVFVSVDIKNVDGLPDSKKSEYYSFLKSRSPLSIDPIFIEPAFSYIQVNSKVKYNINNTTRSPQNIKAAIILKISEYADTYLNNFDAKLRYSKLIQSIDSVDVSIVSNDSDLVLYKKIYPVSDLGQNFIVPFNMALQLTDYAGDSNFYSSVHKNNVDRTITSSVFNYLGSNCILEDDGIGKIKIVKPVGNYHNVIKDIGTVDYTTGLVKLNNLNISSYDGNSFKIYAKTRDKDIIGAKNEITSIEYDEINVSVEAIRE